MAIFKANLTNAENAKTVEDLKSYIYELNEQLNYVFNNLTPEDNFSASALEDYKRR